MDSWIGGPIQDRQSKNLLPRLHPSLTPNQFRIHEVAGHAAACHLPALTPRYTEKDRKKMPSAAVYVVETTFEYGFDSFRAHHLFQQLPEIVVRRHAGQIAPGLPALRFVRFCLVPL